MLDLDPGEGVGLAECAEVARLARTILTDMGLDPMPVITILTFGPDGMTGHQAHMDVCRWATEAFEAAAKPGARLYYATQTPEFVAEVVPADRAVQHLPSGDTAGHPAGELAIDFVAEGEVLDLKLASLEAHESQIEGLLEVFGGDGLSRFLRDESFRDGGRKEG